MSQEGFEEVKSKIEAILFSYGDWISINEIMRVAEIDSKNVAENALKELQEKFSEGYSFTIETNESEKWKMSLKKGYEELVSNLVSGVEMPQRTVKVLSVIAYEQPVTKTRLNEILGRSVKQDLDYLYKENFITYRKKGIGKYFRVTKKFHNYFEIENEEEFREMANKEIASEEE